MRPQRGHAEALVGVPDLYGEYHCIWEGRFLRLCIPDLDGGVAAGGDNVLAAAAEHDVVDPVGVVLHGLQVRVLRVLHVPYPEHPQ